MKRLMSWWHRKHCTRSFKKGENITDWEAKTIHKTGGCPDCGGGLTEGPYGGPSVNYLCIRCHSEFNLTCIGEVYLSI